MARFDEDPLSGVTAAVKAGIALAEPTTLVAGHALAFVVPDGAKVEQVDIEKYLERPVRKRGSFNLSDAKSFIAFVNREKTAETYILANRENPGFTAVFNGNEAENASLSVATMSLPGWGDYKASYACPYSPEWNVWKAANGKKMSQAEFALFMEDNWTDVIQLPVPGTDMPDPAWPDGGKMLAVSRGLEARNDVTFASAIKLSNGEVQFKYEEQISGSVQNGVFEIPQKFAVGVPVFAGTQPWALVAKLRYRIERGGLSMWYDFERLFKVTERAFDEARNEIATGTSVPIYLGARG